MKNLKKYCVILAVAVFFTGFNSLSYAGGTEEIIDFKVDKGVGNIMEFNYERMEDGEMVLYEETLTNNHAHTKKYKDGVLVDEFDSFININDSGEIRVRIDKGNSSEIITVGQSDINGLDVKGSISPNAIVPGNRVRHPLDNEYYRALETGGHLGFERLTIAVITGVISGLVSGGSLVYGSIGSIASIIVNGGFRNVYYTRGLYYPYGNDMKGRPLSKTILKIYSGNDKSRQLGNTLYYDSDLTVAR